MVKQSWKGYRALLYIEGDFLQVIEGPEVAVLELLNQSKDKRHKGIITNGKCKVVKTFSKWNMDFALLTIIKENQGLWKYGLETLAKINDKITLTL
jgi:hypothetical protein